MTLSKRAHKVAKVQVKAFVGIGMKDPFFNLNSKVGEMRYRAGYHLRCRQRIAGLAEFAESSNSGFEAGARC
jgi:hypothetical protein